MRRLVVPLMLPFALVACGGSDSSSDHQGRAQVVESLVRGLEAGDCQQVKDAVVTPSEIECDDIAESAGMLEAEGIDVDDVTYKSGPVAGSSSTVKISWGNDLPPETTDVQRVEGEWLVVFDSDV